MILCSAALTTAVRRRYAPESRPSPKLDRRRRIDAAVTEGYRRAPPTSADVDAATLSLRDAIVEEPW